MTFTLSFSRLLTSPLHCATIIPALSRGVNILFVSKLKFFQLPGGIEAEVAERTHFLADLRAVLAAPGGKGDGHVLLFRHGIGQLHVVHHQQLLRAEAVFFQNGFQGIVAGLALVLRQVPAEDIIRLDTNVNSEMSVYVGNIRKFTALPGSSQDKYAVRITSVIREGE